MYPFKQALPAVRVIEDGATAEGAAEVELSAVQFLDLEEFGRGRMHRSVAS